MRAHTGEPTGLPPRFEAQMCWLKPVEIKHENPSERALLSDVPNARRLRLLHIV
jgi:hypothetical protein